ncbi:MAG: linear amide C-N hydrolase [Olsenella sp.]|jgi:penicillin V acylase-like amidase (Ntn superfamily)|nr:linear amide C-N hydrolase [Olsenella sp.]
MRANIEVPAEEGRAVAACFHALEPVAVPLGAARDPHGEDFTQYTAFVNVESATYYLRTYDNPVVVSASLEELLAADLKPDASGARDHGSINRPATYAHF